MNFIIWLVVGGLIGWVASMIMKTDAQQGVVLNVVVEIIGAFLGGWLISPLAGVPTINQNAVGLKALLVSLVGAGPLAERQSATQIPTNRAVRACATNAFGDQS